jgi:hypothetical protein
MKQIDFDAYFDKVYKAVTTEATKSAEVQIQKIQDELKKTIENNFIQKVAMLVKNDVIDETDAKDIIKKYGCPKTPSVSRSVKATPSDIGGGCSGGGFVSRGC